MKLYKYTIYKCDEKLNHKKKNYKIIFKYLIL